MISLLFPAYKFTRESTQPENMYDIAFEKAKDCGGTVNRISDYAEAAVRSGSIEKLFWEISQNSQENTCAGVSFLRKLDAVNK